MEDFLFLTPQSIFVERKFFTNTQRFPIQK